MPKDKVARETEKKPKFSFQALQSAATLLGPNAEKEQKKLAKAQERKAYLEKEAADGSKFAKKELAAQKKAEFEKKYKSDARDRSEQLGLGRQSENEPRGKNKAEKQKANADALLEKLNKMPKGPKSRNAARKILSTINNGAQVGNDPVTGKPTIDKGAADRYIGNNNRKEIMARLTELAGKTYSGANKERTGSFQQKADAPNTIRMSGVRSKRDYVKARRDVDVTKSKRSKLSQVPKNPRGRPKGSKNKPKQT